jgi:hypothetical protein
MNCGQQVNGLQELSLVNHLSKTLTATIPSPLAVPRGFQSHFGIPPALLQPD